MKSYLPGLFWSAAAAVMLATALVPPAVAGEQASIKAFAAWEGHGQTVPTGPNSADFVGTIEGTVYVDTDKGPIASGRMVCAALIEINSQDGTQSGSGRCTITAKDGARVFVDLICKGVHLVGCSGDSTLTGGTGRFQGITGGGRFTNRTEPGAVVGTTGSVTEETARGIIFWPDLRYAIP